MDSDQSKYVVEWVGVAILSTRFSPFNFIEKNSWNEKDGAFLTPSFEVILNSEELGGKTATPISF